MRPRRYRTMIAGAAALALLLAACGESDTEEPDETATPDESSDDDPDEGSQDVDTQGLEVAYASDLDPNDIADQFGIEEAGAEITELTEDSAVVAGLNNGDFEIGNIDITAAIKAVQGGVPLKIVYVSQQVPEFVMVAQEDITELSDLEGATVAYHSPGSLTEIVQRELVRQHDPELEDTIDWTVLPESPNRASAMAAGRIDATSLEFLDIVALQEQGEFNVLGDWEDLEGPSSDAMATGWVVSEEYLEGNREVVEAFIGHLQTGYDQVYDDKDAWLEKATSMLSDADEDALSQAYDFYVENEMYPQSDEPPATPESWENLDGFFRQIGEYEQEASPDMVDFDLMEVSAG